MIEPIVKVDSISKNYKKKTVLHPSSFSISKGRCVVLCGGNGAGKSTIIKLLTGIEKPTSGTVTFHTKGKKLFGYMPDQMVFPRELTPIEILMYYGNFLGCEREKMNEVIKKVGLWDERNQKVGSFSKGMSQRVNLAQCLLADVDVYILDEPTNGLDPYWVITFKQIIKELKEKGKTVILSSHIMRDIAEIADDIILLFRGKVCGEGHLEELYEKFSCTSLEEIFLSLHQQHIS
ncbi:ABC transporter ATP-binding protein [Ferdinandcohnia quinoae]|uniref:ABC transporter ATP-binding protein n=1 Tax=Fredinandcohnia quinoae TaxID=2918902 RepID=A0AAW5E685_9BACI|nr:ABC transporter ATP-binding protein [Fredinandcohnia sp. SECRCQ15]MCH1625402.1 ABC transporter ATP-binding protein [Fredinandcohnia sp. SECRCQ15]